MIVGVLDRFITWMKKKMEMDLKYQMFNHNYMEYRKMMREQKESNTDDFINQFIETNKKNMFPNVQDKEGEEMTLKLNEVFVKLDKNMKGEFSKNYD